MFVTLSVATVLIALVHGVPLEPKADPDYRLPSDLVEVKNYNIELVVTNETFFQTHKFQGTVKIDFALLNSTNYIKIHGNKIVPSSVILQKSGEVVNLEQTEWIFDDVTDILTLTTQTELQPGKEYLLTFEYEAEFKTDQMYGFYKSTYTDTDGTEKVLGSTQFQPTHARKVFPCFDEPSYKATFDIKITHPSNYKALGNSEATTSGSGSTIITTFARTPPMSTYLIAFVVSEFTCDTSEGQIATNLPHIVCSRDSTKPLRAVALDVGPKLVEAMETFTGVKYNVATIPKMHQVAIPDFSAGAMENWGLITYRETALLWDETHSSNKYKQSVETVIAHEIAHMWFGNLVTMNWWSVTFLNEGFATFFEYFITAKVEPSWELDKQFVVEQIHAVLRSDAQPTSAALSHSVSSPAQVSGRFNAISYNKGGTVLRMVEHILGEEYFKTAINTYLNNNEFSNTIPEDLWTALQPPDNVLPTGSSLTQVMDNWVNKAGYPLVSVVSNGTHITLSQKRFLLSGEDTESVKWYVPISYVTAADPNFDNPEVKDWIIPLADTRTIRNATPQDEWIVVNVLQKGYYRVDYDDILWSRIETALKTDHTAIHEINRAQLIDDLYSLAQVGTHPFSKVLDFYKYLQKETSYLPWYAALNAFSQMLQKTGNDKIIGEISSLIISLIDTAYKALPFDAPNNNNHIYTLNRVQINTWACKSGLQDCLNKALSAFADYKSTKNKPDKNLRSVIYCNGLRHSTDIENDWNFLWEEYLKSDLATEKVTILSALGCATDENVLIGYLNKSIDSSSGIKQQDALSAFSAVYTQNPGGVDTGLDFLIKNYKAIENYYGSLNSVSNLITGLAARFTKQAQIDKLQTFISSTTDLTESLITAAESALTNARNNLEWTKNFEDQLTSYFNINDNNNTADMFKPHYSSVETVAHKQEMHYLPYYFLIITAVYGIYRLPQNAIPNAYKVTIQIDSDYFISERFKGSVNITFEIINETNSIQIHTHSLTGFNFTLTNHNKTFKLTNSHFISDAKDILTINSEAVLTKGRYNLFVTYEGSFTQDLTGLYIPRNKTNGKLFMVATQMALTEARKIFPCFDEPQYKATFQFTIKYPENYEVFSNTGINSSYSIQPHLNVARFEKTPIMSTYLNAFIISNFTCDSAKDSILYRVCSRDETKSDRKFALDIAPKFVKFLEGFTNFAYNKSSMSKVDLIALPEFKYGGMENWGLITFREKALLIDENLSSALNKQNVALIVAHELSHMWFGNLVTCKWWSDVFLNEGLAKYFEYLTANEVFPEWELHQQFVVNVLHTILKKDVNEIMPPLSSNVETPAEISGKINEISYLKGASVIRMIANAMGLQNFKSGIQEYIKQYQFKNVLAENFWSSFKNTELTYDVSEIFKNWTYHSGYPVLYITLNKKDVIVTQEKFLIRGNVSTKWYVPITYDTSNNANISQSQLWLTPFNNSLVIKNAIPNKSDWIIFNHLQTGYYRVNYDDTLWDRIKKVLQTNHQAINVVNRAQIVDDLFNLAKAGKVPYRKVLEITKYLENETDYYPWYSAFKGFSELLPRISSYNQTELKMKMHILNLLKKLYNSTPFVVSDDPTHHIFSLKQSLAVKLACNLDHPDCVNNTKTLFESFKKGPGLRKNLGFEILCTSLRHSANTDDWNMVYNKFQASNVASEEETFLLALTCTTNETLLEKLLVSTFISLEISKIYRDQVFLSVITASSAGLDTANNFLVKYYDRIYCINNNNDLFMKNLISVLGLHFTNESQINKIAQLLSHPTVSKDIANHLKTVTKFARDRFITDRILNERLLDYLDNPNSTSKITGNLILLVASYYLSRYM